MAMLVVRPRYDVRDQSRAKAVQHAESVAADVAGVRVMPSPPQAATRAGARSRSGRGGARTDDVRVLSRFVSTADDRAADQLRARLPSDVVVEELITFEKAQPFDLLRASPLDLMPFMREAPLAAAVAGGGGRLTVRARGREGRRSVPLRGAEVYAFLSASGQVRERLEAHSDADGVAEFTFPAFYVVHSVIVVPYNGHWPKVVRGPRPTVDVACEPLPRRGAWWHEVVGVRPETSLGVGEDGRPIKVGVIDSGCGPHRSLAHVIDHGAIIGGEFSADGSDSGSHGTHVSGIIGARADSTGLAFSGVAPGVELHSVRVFPPVGGANQGDIADAIDTLVAAGVDLINMSLGAPVSSVVLGQAIDNAMNEGVLCVCAAGNDSGPVSYPAFDPNTVAIAAVGQLGTVPEDSLPALPTNAALYGLRRLHAADFTNFGPEIGVCSPGVGIVSTVPERHGYDDPFASMNGTSMASPLACGLLAAILATDSAYMSMPGERRRARHARNALFSTAASIELPQAFEGRGLPGFSRRALA